MQEQNLYHLLQERLVSGLFATNNEYVKNEPSSEYGLDESYISSEDMKIFLQTELLPYFQSIFSKSNFEVYVNNYSSNYQDLSLIDGINLAFVEFLRTQTNDLYHGFKNFIKNNDGIYKGVISENLKKEAFLFVFRNTVFNGENGLYIFNANKEAFIKQCLSNVLIKLRIKFSSHNRRLVSLEINRLQILVLKQSSHSFLNWYLIELKSVLEDFKPLLNNIPSYKLSCSETVLEQLYVLLNRYDFIDIEHTSLNDFKAVLLNDWNSHKSICVLKMDNPQTKFFIDQFKIYIDKSLTITNIQRAKNICNKSGFINGGSLNASSSRNKLIGPKRQEDLIAVFSAV